MEITNALLNDLGADPKVYSSEEKALMSEFADKIIAGELSSLLESCTLPEERLAKLRDHFSKNSDSLLADMKETAVCAEALATLYAQKSTVFVSSLSFEEKDDLIMSSLRITNKINDLRDQMLDCVLHIYAGVEPLLEVEYMYNKTLARLGMINLAALAAEKEGVAYNEEAIMSPIMDAYEKLTDLTEFINDLKDKSTIYEKSAEIRLGNALGDFAEQIDLMNDGKNINVNGIMSCAATIKRIAEDVLNTYL